MTFNAHTLLLPLLLLGVIAWPSAADADATSITGVKAFISAQVEAIKAGDIAKVKAGLSPRQREKVTAERVAKAKTQVDSMTIDDLVASVQPSQDAKAPTEVEVKMKNGRTLTTLIKVEGTWVADTLWFN
ncbi:hypothetical protein BH11MYX3_BH11MYX3_42540 [soil metagenome]